MCDELKEEIEKAKLLGRRDRIKKEKELQRKYNDKSIRILKGKTFTKGESLGHNVRRQLVKDKNLLKEILKIINKYLPQFNKLLSELTDKRNKSYITYKIRTIVMTRLFALICGITTMTEINSSFNTEDAIKNLSIL